MPPLSYETSLYRHGDAGRYVGDPHAGRSHIPVVPEVPAKKITNEAMSLMPGCQSNEREQHGTMQSTRNKKRFVLLTGPSAIAFACPSHVPWQDHIDQLPKSRTSVSPQKLVKQKMKKSGFYVLG